MTEPALGLLSGQCSCHGGYRLLLDNLLLAIRQSLWLSLALSVIQIAEEEDARSFHSFGLLDEPASALVAPECCPEWGLGIGLVVVSHDLSNVNASLTSVVEWNGRDEMVADMSANNVVEEMGVNKAEITINGSRGTASKIPGLGIVVRHGCVGVLEEGDSHYQWGQFSVTTGIFRETPTDPVVHPQPWDTPQDNDVPASKHLTCDIETENHGGNSDI